MAGTLFARTQPNMPAQARARALSRPLVRRCVAIEGSRYSALVPEGASMQEILREVAKAHGGGVAEVYDEKLNAHEIVVVKIGRHLLVKGDPAKVAEADFSQFDDPSAMKGNAVAASHESEGGLHLFLGKTGIPVAIQKDGRLVFPNGEEMHPGRDSDDIHISLVDYDANPLTLDDLKGMYSGGVNISERARSQMLGQLKQELSKEKIAEGHGGMRSEKLMLPDTSVLVLNMESGDIMTVSEHGRKAEGFRAPRISIQDYSAAANASMPSPQEHPRPFNQGLLIPTDLGPVLIPLDGSEVRIPYLCVKVFDGRVEDAVSVINPVDELKKLPVTGKDMRSHQETRRGADIQLPLVLIRNVRGMPKVKGMEGMPKPAFILRPLKIQNIEREKPTKKEKQRKIDLRVERPVNEGMHLPRMPVPDVTKSRRRLLAAQPAIEIVFPRIVVPNTKMAKQGKRGRKAPASAPRKPVRKAKKRTIPKTEAKKKSRKRGRTPLGLPPLSEPKRRKRRTVKPRRTSGPMKVTNPKQAENLPGAEKRTPRKRRPVAQKRGQGKEKGPEKKSKVGKKTKASRRKMAPLYLKEMLGLFRMSRRARAGSSR